MNCNVFPLFRGASRQRLKHQIDQQSTHREDGKTSSYFSVEHLDATRHTPPGSKKTQKKTEKQIQVREETKFRYQTRIPTKNIPNWPKMKPTTNLRNKKRPPR